LLWFEVLDKACHSYAGHPHSAQTLAEFVFTHHAGYVRDLPETSEMILKHTKSVWHAVGEVNFVVCMLEIVGELKLIIFLFVFEAG